MATNASTRSEWAAATRSASRAETPWGRAVVLEQAVMPQRAGEKRFNTLIELLETERGERLVRFAYSTGGSARRGPVTVRVRDLDRLRTALAKAPELEAELRLGGDA